LQTICCAAALAPFDAQIFGWSAPQFGGSAQAEIGSAHEIA
jgi:hypothetical protein